MRLPPVRVIDYDHNIIVSREGNQRLEAEGADAPAGAGLTRAPVFAAERATTGSAVLTMSRQIGSAVGVAALLGARSPHGLGPVPPRLGIRSRRRRGGSRHRYRRGPLTPEDPMRALPPACPPIRSRKEFMARGIPGPL